MLVMWQSHYRRTNAGASQRPSCVTSRLMALMFCGVTFSPVWNASVCNLFAHSAELNSLYLLAPSTSRDSSSSRPSKGDSTLCASWEDVPISRNVAAPLIKRYSTAAKKKAVSTAHGGLASLRKPVDRSALQHSSESSMSSEEEDPCEMQRWPTARRTSASTVASNITSTSSKKRQRGESSVASSSRDRLAVASRRSFTTHSLPMTFTLSQSRHHFGSTATLGSVFSSLMSIKASLSGKSCSESWMAIATMLNSRAASLELAGIASCLRPTVSSDNGETTQSDDDFQQEATSDSQASEDNTLDCNNSSDQESD